MIYDSRLPISVILFIFMLACDTLILFLLFCFFRHPLPPSTFHSIVLTFLDNCSRHMAAEREYISFTCDVFTCLSLNLLKANHFYSIIVKKNLHFMSLTFLYFSKRFKKKQKNNNKVGENLENHAIFHNHQSF